jgi:hypothetical protein
MASSYPGALDSFTNPTSTDAMDASAALYHDVQHANINDAVEAIEAELGTDPAGAQATVKARLDNVSHSQLGPWGSGVYLSNHFGNTNEAVTYGLSANWVYFVPLWIPVSATLDRIAIRVTTGGGAGDNCRIGLYGSDSAGGPTGGATADFGEIDASGTGVKELTISQAVNGGTYQWVAIHNESSAGVRVAGIANYGARSFLAHQTPTDATLSGYVQTGATYSSGLPTVGTLSNWTGVVIWVTARRT